MRVLSRQQAFDLIDQLSSPCFIQNPVVFWIRSCRFHFPKVTIFTREESERFLKVLLSRLAQCSTTVRDHFNHGQSEGLMFILSSRDHKANLVRRWPRLHSKRFQFLPDSVHDFPPLIVQLGLLFRDAATIESIQKEEILARVLKQSFYSRIFSRTKPLDQRPQFRDFMRG